MVYSTVFTTLYPLKSVTDTNKFIESMDGILLKALQTRMKKKCNTADDVIINTQWRFINPKKGYIYVDTTRELTEEELKALRDWTRGQCSDGIGDAISQMGSFAIYKCKKHYNCFQDNCMQGCDENAEPTDDYIGCLFNWTHDDLAFSVFEEN